MFSNSRLVGFLATSMPARSRIFYTDTLGFDLLEETPFAIVVTSGNSVVRIQKTEQVFPPPYTSLGWEVEDIVAMVDSLTAGGVQFERFDGLEQNASGIWTIPGGAKVAWFKDPDGNLLSLTQVV